jgi:hypothetical protein
MVLSSFYFRAPRELHVVSSSFLFESEKGGRRQRIGRFTALLKVGSEKRENRALMRDNGSRVRVKLQWKIIIVMSSSLVAEESLCRLAGLVLLSGPLGLIERDDPARGLAQLHDAEHLLEGEDGESEVEKEAGHADNRARRKDQRRDSLDQGGGPREESGGLTATQDERNKLRRAKGSCKASFPSA